MTPARVAWVLNLDAEFELARPTYTPSARLLAELARRGEVARSLLGAEDRLVGPGAGKLAAEVGRAWCATPRALALLRAAGVEPEPHPSFAVLRAVNHRRFAHELGGGLPGQHYVENRASLERLLAGAALPLVLKRPLTCAGRGQLRVYGPPSAYDWSWVEASFRVDGLLVEPLVRPLVELCLHGFVWPGGAFELGRPCIQEVSERGVYRGSRVPAHEELSRAEEQALFTHGERAARALARASYFGPFGIDAHRYERQGEVGFCALSELNARYTMGFAMGFPRPVGEIRMSAPPRFQPAPT